MDDLEKKSGPPARTAGRAMTPRRKPKPRAEKSPGGPGRKRRPAEKRDLVASMVFAIPFLSVAAINLRNTVALCAALFIILVPVSVLRFLLREQLSVPQWLSVPLCSMVSLMLASLSYYLIRFVSVEITDALGTYLYLLAAYPVLAAASSEQDIDSVPSALRCALRYFFRFTCLGLVMDLILQLPGGRRQNDLLRADAYGGAAGWGQPDTGLGGHGQMAQAGCRLHQTTLRKAVPQC